MMRLILILFLSVALSNYSFSQCPNSIQIERTYTYLDNNSQVKGAIEVSVTSSEQFIGFLNIEKGSGPEQIQQKEGRNNTKLLFENLDLDKTYQVHVEFNSDGKDLCSKLQRSGIIIEAE